MMALKNKVAIVTGASGEVGRSISKRLLSEGCKVVLVGRNRTNLGKFADELGNKNFVLSIPADITKEAEVLNVLDQTISVFDTVDILINNAGIINDPTPFHQMTDDQWNSLINTNMIGTFRMTKAVIPVMVNKGGGNIVNISSVLGLRSIPNVPFSIYGVTKAAIIQFTRSIAVEYGSYGIRSNCIAPSTIRSSIIEPFLQDENAKKILEGSFPLKKIGEPEDISGAISYLCSNDAKWVTGTILVVDGGISSKQ